MCERVVYDCALINFYETKIDKPILLSQREKVSIAKYFPNHQQDMEQEDYDNPFSGSYFPEEYSDVKYAIQDFNISYIRPLRKSDVIYNIISLGDGKLSIYGASAYNALCGKRNTSFDFCFHSCAKYEASNILREIQKYIYRTWALVESYKCGKKYVFYMQDLTIKFDLNIYKDEREAIQNIKRPSCRLCWNISSNFCCSVVTGLLISLVGCEYPMSLDGYDSVRTPNIKEDIYKMYRSIYQLDIYREIKHIIFLKWLKSSMLDARDRLVTDY